MLKLTTEPATVKFKVYEQQIVQRVKGRAGQLSCALFIVRRLFDAGCQSVLGPNDGIYFHVRFFLRGDSCVTGDAGVLGLRGFWLEVMHGVALCAEEDIRSGLRGAGSGGGVQDGTEGL